MQVYIEPNLTLIQVKRILSEIRAKTGEFALFDPLYPSPSDPGAYLSYSSKMAPESAWRMTLGNHGWSGGIYIIPQGVIETQITNLAHKGLVKILKTEGVVFFDHYAMESEEKNNQRIEVLNSIHRNGKHA